MLFLLCIVFTITTAAITSFPSTIALISLYVLPSLILFFCSFFFFSTVGTNAFPRAAESSYYNKQDYLTKYLDSSKFTEKEKNNMNTLIAHHQQHGTPYLCFGRGSSTFQLNDENQVTSISFEWKLTSICNPVVEKNC